MSGKSKRATVLVAAILVLVALAAGAYRAHSRGVPAIPTIAFIPQSTGAMLWDVERLGATAAAEKLAYRIHWNAPTSESDMAGQVSLIDKVVRGKYQGLVLAPNHTLGIRAPLYRAVAAGLPVVIISAQVELPASSRVSYIVNDDELMGELAATEIARLMHGQGSIALVGLARFTPGVARRVRGAERLLANRYPGISVVSRVGGANSDARTRELTNASIANNPALNGVLSFTAASTRGAHAALKSRSLQTAIPLVGCEQDADLIGYVGTGELAAIVAENTYRMGYEAVGLISDSLAGKPLPAQSLVPPLLITKRNLNSPEASLFTSVAVARE
jgi:ribose transport system substrate-binding protein